jgi:phosphoenolpyruvate carboxykinase (GTP)
MADYFGHWLKVGRMTDAAKLPRLYYVNWFRKDSGGRFVWPGFGENSRVLKWIIERLDGDAKAVETPIGNLPAPGALDTDGLRLSEADLDLLLTVDPQAWKLEADRMPEFFQMFGDHLPERLWELYQDLVDRLGSS